MGKSRWANEKTNRLHRDKQRLQKHGKNSMGIPTMARKHGAAEEALGNKNGHNAKTRDTPHKKPLRETGKRIKYDIAEMRTEPGKLRNGIE